VHRVAASEPVAVSPVAPASCSQTGRAT
jgi:hypothetical protein